MAEAWQLWADEPECEGTLVRRAKNDLPQMESTKQLVKILRPVYKPGMRILDVGCNAGHYLRGILELDAKVKYTGVDAYAHYIDQAKQIYKDFVNVNFDVKDIFQPLFPKSPFDITYCCNVIIHLPDLKRPLRNLLESTTKVCVVRTLIGDRNTIVKQVEGDEIDEKGEPKRWVYQNTYTKSYVTAYAKTLGWKTEFIDDEYDPRVLADEHGKLKANTGTGIIDGRQVDANIIFNWKFIRFTPLKG